MALWPFKYSDTTTTWFPDGTVRTVFSHYPGPLILRLGLWEVLLLLAPVALTGLGIWLAWPRSSGSVWSKPALWGLGVLCLAYCYVPIWFVRTEMWFVRAEIWVIGVFFLPAAVMLIVSAIIVSRQKRVPNAA